MSGMISYDERLHAIRAIKKAISPSDSFMGTADVEVKKGGELLLRCCGVDIITSYEAGYMQYRISIMWEESGIESFDSLGLRGSYNTNFNKMDRVNGDLVIHAENHDIVISIN